MIPIPRKTRDHRPAGPCIVLAASILFTSACGQAIPEGQYRCTPGDDSLCPLGWYCRADSRCYSAPSDAAGCVPECVDDGNECNGREICYEGECIQTRPPSEGTECTNAAGAAGHCFVERCRPVDCGNGAVDSGEECDDGNFVDGDGCESDCTFSCMLTAECIDGEACNGDESCSGHRCMPGEFLPTGTTCGSSLICLRGVCVGGGCGDGVVDAASGEECDDANDVSGDGCENDCRFSCHAAPDCDDLSFCNGQETCDPAAHRCDPGVPAADGTPCTLAVGGPGACRGGSCAGTSCGNGVVDAPAGEECDDGNLIAGDGCENDCTWTCHGDPECADASSCNGAEMCNVTTHVCLAGTAVADGTECDRDADPATRDICLAGACSPSTCGDTFVDPIAGEQCDDGNAVPGDGCEATCRYTCTVAADCADGESCNGEESCDLPTHTCLAGAFQLDGTPCTIAGGAPGVCRAGACARVGCGNGTVEPSEECDDGNTVPGDGCETTCVFSCHADADCREVPDDPCTTDVCLPITFGQACDRSFNRLPCDDHDACTADDACDGAGACRGMRIDIDGDTYGPGVACGGDCNDADAAVHPGAAEACNGIDDDCNGIADDGFPCVLGSTRSCAVCGRLGTDSCVDGCSWGGCDAAHGEICNDCDDDLDTIIDGHVWCEVSSPAADDLLAIWGSAATDVWAVGTSGNIVRWDGAVWSAVASGTGSDLTAVWAASDSAAWAVGPGGTILWWDGIAWGPETAPVTADWQGVWGASPDDLWAVGTTGAIVHRTGGAWAATTSGTPRTLRGVWGRAPDQVWTAGDQGTVRRWNGATWIGDGTTGTTRNLYAVGGTSGSEVWAVGAAGAILLRTGGSPSWVVTTSGTATLRGMWARSATKAWVVGDGGTILGWNGTTWLPSTSGTANDLHGVWGYAPAEMWAVGAGPIVLRWRE